MFAGLDFLPQILTITFPTLFTNSVHLFLAQVFCKYCKHSNCQPWFVGCRRNQMNTKIDSNNTASQFCQNCIVLVMSMCRSIFKQGGGHWFRVFDWFLKSTGNAQTHVSSFHNRCKRSLPLPWSISAMGKIKCQVTSDRMVFTSLVYVPFLNAHTK